MSSPSWEHFAHVADMGVRGIGPTREAAFEQAAMGLCALVTDLDTVRAEEEVRVRCEAPDDEVLLVDWLNAVVYEMACRHMVFARFRVDIQDHRLSGSLWGERVDPERHPPGVEVKGATFTELAVRRDEDGTWAAGCVVDV
jgi:tRNA nucleotidyltransferase (CCA-adding enzyme)